MGDVAKDGAPVSRRELFQVIGSVPAVAALSAGPALAQTHKPPLAAYQRKIFDEHQWRTLRVICDLIIPADEHSGSASQAGVGEFIDDWLDFRKHEDGNEDLAAQILGGLVWLDCESTRLFAKPFAGASVSQQKQILDRIAWPERAAPEDRRWAAFFSKVRDLTSSGFFSSDMGIRDLPYLGNTAVAEWKGCDPTVWAKIEERMQQGYKGLGGDVKPLTD
jgi:gluconate 2-dehydrogenase gamma chain